LQLNGFQPFVCISLQGTTQHEQPTGVPELIGRTVIFQYPDFAPAVGIIKKIAGSNFKVEFSDRFVGSFKLSDVLRMLLPDLTAYRPASWLSSMRQL
jgi:hypothetical protein